jgi:hypothetical protein
MQALVKIFASPFSLVLQEYGQWFFNLMQRPKLII